MKIEFNSKTITNISEWEKLVYSGKKAKDWKLGRSAHALTDFILNKNGETFIKNEVSKAIGEELELDVAYSEYEHRFDQYGHGREHDLGIFGKTASGKTIFIGVEAKVDESFGDTISDAYLKAKTKELNGEETNAPKRIEELLIRNFGQIKKNHFNLRYQLLYSTVGTTSVKADLHVFFVLVFKTALADPLKVKSNKNDYRNFFKRLNVIQLTSADAFEVDIDNQKLIAIYKEI